MTAGEVVILDFPFSDLRGSKVRPAIVVADVGAGDFVACQVTSNSAADSSAIELTASGFVAGGLRLRSFARPSKLFTAHDSIVSKVVGRLKDSARDQIKDAIIDVIRKG